jgi:DNA-binding response OmpR family regulator
MSENGHILIVDDDERLRRLVSNYLKREGFSIGEAADGAGMWHYLENEQPDLILLDLMLPGADGISLARELRLKYNIGIIILTGKSDVVDTIVGLEVGADDYITKPFNDRELLARIHSLLRRLSNKKSNAENDQVNQHWKIVEFDGWRLNLSTYEFTSPLAEPVHLTTHEFKLLQIFVQNTGHVLSRDQILQKLSSRDWSPDDRSIDVLVGRLRKAMQDDPAKPQIIHTIRNAGYQFTPKVKFSSE